MKTYAIIVAGGSGARMKSTVPKQFLLLQGKPVLMHTIQAFINSSYKPEVILVMNQDYLTRWQELCNEYQFDTPITVVAGGATRFQSVKNGLERVSPSSLVAVHDAVRPLVSAQLITSAFDQAKEYGTAVPAILSKDSIRQGSRQASRALNRDEIFLVQTPQTFKSDILKNAYQQPDADFTDDASVVERSGESIRIIDGDPLNIKITFPEDLALAQVFLNMRK